MNRHARRAKAKRVLKDVQRDTEFAASGRKNPGRSSRERAGINPSKND